MKYRVTLTILAAALVISLPSFISAQSKSSSDNKGADREFLIQFNKPMAPAEVVGLVKRTKVKARELLYEFPGEQDDTIVGGYVLDPGQDIDAALADMSKKHAAFLSEALKETTQQITGSSDPAITDNLKKLGKTFSKLLDEANGNRFTLSGLKATDVGEVSKLELTYQIKSVTQLVKTPAAQTPDAVSENIFRPASYWHERWAPYYGTAKVNQGSTFQTFYFNNISDYGSSSTYEHETQVYNKSFADFANYWSSNLPYAYVDTPFLDTIDNFTVGSARAIYLRTYVQYYTYMALRAGTAYSATVRIKGQKGYRSPSWCTSPWCIWPEATTSSSMLTFTAPIYYTLSYYY